MNDDDVREALRAAASVRPEGVRVDPAAARRAGEVRARTRTAVSTSLAFSLVILAGFGAVFFAAHRSRPTTLGSDGLPAPTVSAAPTSAPLATLLIRFQGRTVEVGQEQTLLLSGELGGVQNDIDIHWGDGQETAATGALAVAGVPCAAGRLHPINAAETHTYSQAGDFVVQATVHATCKSSAGAAFHVQVQPSPSTPVVAAPTTSSPYVSATPAAPSPRSTGQGVPEVRATARSATVSAVSGAAGTSAGTRKR